MLPVCTSRPCWVRRPDYQTTRGIPQPLLGLLEGGSTGNPAGMPLFSISILVYRPPHRHFWTQCHPEGLPSGEVLWWWHLSPGWAHTSLCTLCLHVAQRPVLALPADPCLAKPPPLRTRRSTVHWSRQHARATSQQRGHGTNRQETGDFKEKRAG